ncbi:MAG: glycerophosphodiester phosphodiesterase [Planctomycetota bacterium]|jgi:glycerophosphoryl diester phosphodiesterase
MKSDKTYIIAHRGRWKNHYENTLIGIETAIASGADFVEIDVRVSLDEEIVAFHDKCINRMTGGKGKISQLKLSDLKQLTVEGQTGKDVIQIPTFEECVETVKGRIGLIFEIKDRLPTHLLKKIISFTKEKLSYASFIMVSRNGELLREIKSIDSKVVTGKLGLFTSFTIPFRFKKTKNYDILIINELVATRNMVEIAKKHGLSVFISSVWGIRNKESLCSLESDGIYVNI